MQRILQNSSLLMLLGWLVAQMSGVVAVAANWEADASYVTWSMLYGVVLVILAACGWLLARYEGRLWRRFAARWRLSTLGLSLLLAGGFALWALPLEPAYPLDALRWLLLTSTVILISLLQIRFEASTQRVVLAVIVAVALGLGLLTLHIYPEIYSDEGLNLNYAWSSTFSGPVYTPSINLGVFGDPQRIDTEVIWWPVGWWLRIAGLGLWQGRFLMWLFTLPLAAFLYHSARMLYKSRQAGIIAALFALCSVLTLYVAHNIRQEIIQAAIIAFALYLHLLAEKHSRFREAFLLGLVLSISLDVHNNMFIYCFAFGGYYLLRALSTMIHKRQWVMDYRLLGIAAGGFVGVALYLLLHAASDPAAFLEQARYYYGVNYGSGDSLLVAFLRRALLLVEHVRSWYALSVIEASMVLIAIGLALLWRKAADRFMLALLVLALVGWTLIGSRPTVTYAANLLPIGALMVGGALARGFSHPGRRFAVSVLLLAAMLGVSVRRVAIAQEDAYNQQFMVCLESLTERLPDDALILGEHLFWLARPELTGYAARTLVELPWAGRNAAEWWAWIAPDIVLWPGWIIPSGYEYVTSQDFNFEEVPECERFLTIWLRPGVALNP